MSASLHVCLCTTCMCVVCRGQNGVLDALTSSELKFQVLVSHYVDAGNQDTSPVTAANAQYC